jgi:hypothetical protein
MEVKDGNEKYAAVLQLLFACSGTQAAAGKPPLLVLELLAWFWTNGEDCRFGRSWWKGMSWAWVGFRKGTGASWKKLGWWWFMGR